MRRQQGNEESGRPNIREQPLALGPHAWDESNPDTPPSHCVDNNPDSGDAKGGLRTRGANLLHFIVYIGLTGEKRRGAKNLLGISLTPSQPEAADIVNDGPAPRDPKVEAEFLKRFFEFHMKATGEREQTAREALNNSRGPTRTSTSSGSTAVAASAAGFTLGSMPSSTCPSPRFFSR